MSFRNFCLGYLLIGAIASAQTETNAGFDLVESFVTDVKTLSGRFEQTLIGPDGQIIEVTNGRLEILRPDRFRWTYEVPYEQVLVADGSNLWFYDIDLAQVTVKPQVQALSETPASLLGGSIDALQQFNFEGSVVKDATTWVVLSPKASDSGFRQVQLGFTGQRLDRMLLNDSLEQTTVVALYEVTVNEALPESLFTFEVPQDVDLIGVPLPAKAMLR